MRDRSGVCGCTAAQSRIRPAAASGSASDGAARVHAGRTCFARRPHSVHPEFAQSRQLASPERQSRHPAGARERRPDTLVLAATIVVVTYVWRVQSIVPALGALRISLVAALTGAMLIAFSRHPARRLRLLRSPLLSLLLVLLGLIVVGLPFSIRPGRTFHFIVWDFVPNLLMVVVVVGSVRRLKDLTWLAGAHIAGAAVYCAFVALTFRVDASTGRLGDIVYYDANDLALALVCTFPFVLFFLRSSAPWLQRWVIIPILLLMLVVFVRTGSRGGLFGLFTISLCALFTYRAIKLPVRVFAISAGVLGLVLFGGDAYWARMRTVLSPHEDYNMTSETGRLNVWKNGLSLMGKHAVVGVGARCYAPANGTLSALAEARRSRGFDAPWEVAHNSYVEIGVELGVPGLLVFLGMLFSGIRSTWRMSTRSLAGDDMRGAYAAFARASSMSLIGFVVSGTFLSAEYMSLLYLLIAFAIAVRKVALLDAGASGAAELANAFQRQPKWRSARVPVGLTARVGTH